MVCYDWTIFVNLQKNLSIEKIIFKVVQMTFTIGNIFMEHDLNILMILAYDKNDNFEPNNVLLAITPNIPVLLMTAFVLLGHISDYTKNHLHRQA